jgi:hypothetical protein
MRSAASREGYDSIVGSDQASPAIVMPAQFFDGAPARHLPAGVRGLMAAVLEDAIEVYLKNRAASLSERRTLHLRARRWFASNDRSYVFSFLRITEALGIDANLVRKALLRAGSSPEMGGLTRLGICSADCRESSN